MITSELEKLSQIRNVIDQLEKTVEKFVINIGRPIFIAEEGKQRFRYSDKSSLVIQVLKSVLVISGFNAIILLLEKGFTQETGALIRSLDDFLGQIVFLEEAHTTGKPTVDQQRFVDLFFSEDLPPQEKCFEKEQKPGSDRVKRKKIQASEARLLDHFENRDKLKKAFKIVDDAFSGYVHGAYPHIMELYEVEIEGFYVRGTQNIRRIAELRYQLALYVHRSLSIFSLIAKSMKFNDLANDLLLEQRSFEESIAYRP